MAGYKSRVQASGRVRIGLGLKRIQPGTEETVSALRAGFQSRAAISAGYRETEFPCIRAEIWPDTEEFSCIRAEIGRIQRNFPVSRAEIWPGCWFEPSPVLNLPVLA